MNPGRFYIPNYMNMGTIPMSRSMLGLTNAPRSMGLFQRLTNGIRSVNWSGLLNNANKTLNVVNQTIPLVRQAGPMVNNMKSMLKIAKAFGNETTKNVNKKNTINHNMNNYQQNNEIIQKKEVDTNNAPNFFI